MGQFDGWEKNPRIVEAVEAVERQRQHDELLAEKKVDEYMVGVDPASGRDETVSMLIDRQAEAFEALRIATMRPGQRMLFGIDCDVMGKPRMTIGDRRRAGKPMRPVVARWHRYKSLLQRAATLHDFTLPCTFEAIFFIPVPSEDYADRIGQVHQMKPDTDNLLKGLKDALCDEDSHIWRDCASKYWTAPGAGRIEIWTL